MEPRSLSKSSTGFTSVDCGIESRKLFLTELVVEGFQDEAPNPYLIITITIIIF
jgi:hypothetical protein